MYLFVFGGNKCCASVEMVFGAFQKLTKNFIDCEPDTGSAAENKNGLIPFEKKISKKA